MAEKKYKGKVLNIVFFVVLLGFFLYYIYTQFDLGYKVDVLVVGGNFDLYSNLIWIGLFVSFVGAIVGYFGMSRATKGSFFRGIIIGFIVGIVVLTIIQLIIAPDWAALSAQQGLKQGVPGIFNGY